MANLKQNNFHNLRIRVNKDEYWDFYIDRDSYGYYSFDDSELYDKCLISRIDLSDKECIDGDSWIMSSNKYAWENALSKGETLYNISYTGLDNGLFQFRKDRISNKDFVEIYQKNKFELVENDHRLKLHAVSGNTLQYEYPLYHVPESGVTKFNGGFYQGFFKTKCDKYYILPSNISDETWNMEFTLKKCNLEPESTKTLNDKYPNNKGIFFYIGTRAENKWIYLYDKDDKYGLEECYELSPDEYVEGGHIDKSDHIIGNFYDLDVDFVPTDPWDMFSEYSTFNYYDEKEYKGNECDIDELDEFDIYIDYGDAKKPKIIDETMEHETLEMCLCPKSSKKQFKYILKPYKRGCGCPIRYRKEIIVEEENTIDYFGNEPFGEDGYISDFDGLDDGTEYLEPEMDISMFEYETDNNFSLNSANQYYFYTDNKFLLFDRTCNGYTIKNWVEGTEMMYYGQRNNFKGNLFIYMNRTCTGYTVNNIDELRNANANDYNPYSDLYNNALAFRITDNGEIGYRYLTIDCSLSGDNKVMIEEGYSFENIIPDCEWCVVNVKIASSRGKMKLYFYVNGKLVYITKDLPNLNLRELKDLYEKQEGVPYNISLGGGTQGLAETILPNYMLNPPRVYPLEEYFAGTFIGYMKDFKFYNCNMDYNNILMNYKYEKNRLI